MPLQHGLWLKPAEGDVFPLHVVLTISTGEALRCYVERIRKRPRNFHITLEPDGRFPQAILDAMARDRGTQPSGLISVCNTPGGLESLVVGEPITLSYTAKNDFPITVEAGTLEGIAIP